MAATIVERVTSRPGRINEVSIEGSEWKLEYLVTGTASEAAAVALVLATAPASFNGLIRNSVEVSPVWVDTADGADDGLWEATAIYGTRKVPDRSASVGIATASFAFSITGGTQHVTLSKETMDQFGKTGEPGAPQTGGMIGWNDETKEAEGVDIVIPKFAFTLKMQVPISLWNGTYLGKIAALAGKTNDDTFTITINTVAHSFDAGEVLFIGGEADEEKSAEFIEITLNFAVSYNMSWAENDVPGFPAFNKGGWEYLWMAYRRKTDPVTGLPFGEPFAIYIERVYDEGDFDGLEP